MRILVWLIVNSLALGAAIWLVGGITLDWDSTGELVLFLAIAGAILGVINKFVRPVVRLLSLPFIILSLGLLLLVINAAMLLLTAEVAEVFEIPFRVDGFWNAVFGGVIISVASAFLSMLLPEE